MQVLRLSRHEITRSRKVNACITCRLRKIKCDREKPYCRKCLSAGRICRYAKDGKFSEAELHEDRGESGSQPGSVASTDGEDSSPVTQDTFGGRSTLFSSQCTRLSTWGLDEIRSTHPQELHELLRWYLQYCDFFVPVEDVEELQLLHENWLCNGRVQDDKDLPTLLAVYATAATAIEACRGSGALSTAPNHWRNLATRLLISQGYPAFDDHAHTRAAVLLALLEIQEGSKGVNMLPVALLARTAQSDLLPFTPSRTKPHTSDNTSRHRLFWHIHFLDTAFSIVAHLPPLLSQASLEMPQPSFEAVTTKTATVVFQHFRARASLLTAQILNQVYHSRPISISTFELLELSTATLVDEAETAAQSLEDAIQPNTSRDGKSHHHHYCLPPTERARTICIAHLLRLTAHKASLTLHSPYLQNSQWPTRSRYSALSSALTYLRTSLHLACTASSPSGLQPQPQPQALQLLPFRWLLKLYDVFQPLEVLMRDLIAHPETEMGMVAAGGGYVVGPDSDVNGYKSRREMLELVEECFAELYEPGEAGWEGLGELRGRVWGIGMGVVAGGGGSSCGGENHNNGVANLGEMLDQDVLEEIGVVGGGFGMASGDGLERETDVEVDVGMEECWGLWWND